MTVAITTSSKDFTGSGSTGPFTFAFRFLANADIKVFKTVAGVKSQLTETTHYTLTGARLYTGGSVTLVTALQTGEALRIERHTASLQGENITNQGANFRPEVHEGHTSRRHHETGKGFVPRLRSYLLRRD